MSKEQIDTSVSIYVMEGAAGSIDYAVVDEGSDDLCLEVYDANGDTVCFESEAYHLERFCKENGLGYQKIVKPISFTTHTKVPG